MRKSRNLWARRPSAPPRRPQPRLGLERLEDRTLLSGGPPDPALLGTPVAPDDPLAVNLRARLSVLVDDQPVAVPSNLGVVDGGHLPLYTGADGQLYVASPVAHDFRLGDFFALWGQSFAAHEFLSLPVDEARPLLMTVNGYATTDLGDRVLRDGDEIVLRYGSSALVAMAGNTLLPEYTGSREPLAVNDPLPTAKKDAPTALLGPADLGVQASPDPAVAGPYAVLVQEYTFGNQAFQHSTAALGGIRSELTARVYAPADLDAPGLAGRALPLVVLLHGRHATVYTPPTGGGFLGWPPSGSQVSIPSYQGYDYLGNNLASHGYIVVSISANAINTFDNNFFNPVASLGALARAELIQRHLRAWADLNATGTVQARSDYGPDTLSGNLTPFGTRFVGRVDLQNVGTMGHSRGGEGVVRHYLLNQAEGSPFGVKGVFALAPVDFARPILAGVPLGVLLPYVDADVSDLQGAHYFDDARYAVPGDPAPKHTFLVLGGNHNFYNTVWTPGLYPFPGAPSGVGGTGDDAEAFIFPPVPIANRLNDARVRATGLVLMASFFRTYLGGEQQFQPLLKGDVPPPASATTDQIFVGYQAPDTPATRLDVNRLLTLADLTTNTLGGAVTFGGFTTFVSRTGALVQTPFLYGGDAPLVDFILPGEPSAAFPHTIPSALSNRRGLSQLILAWENTYDAFWQNDLPAGARDVRGYYALEVRAIVNFTDPRDRQFTPGDFSVVLTDAAGNSASTQAGLWSRSLLYPPIENPQTPGRDVVIPHNFMNDVRIPLTAFVGVNLSDVVSIRFNFDQRAQGNVLLADLQFADRSDLYAGPFVAALAAPAELGPVGSIEVGFNAPIDPATFDPSDVTVTGPGGVVISVASVTAVPGASNARYTLTFEAALGAVGVYTVVVGPDVRDPSGRLMDQDFDRAPGEASDDTFVGTFTLRGARVIASVPPTAFSGAPPTSARITFSTAIDPSTFTAEDVLLTGPGGAIIPVTGVAAVPASGDIEFEISFDPLTALGAYTLTVGPQVFDLFGSPLDQNDNLTPGEVPGDRFVLPFTVSGPRVTAVTPPSGGTAAAPVGSVRLTFSRPIDPTTFTVEDVVSFVRVSGTTTTALTVTGVAAVAGSGETQFDVFFDPQTAVGRYTLVVGPDVRDTFGFALDQNSNFVPGEDPGDRFTTQFVLAGPRVIAVTPTNGAVVAAGQSSVTVTFDRAMDPTTFTAEDVDLTRAAGGTTVAVAVTGVTAVAGSGDRQFVIAFAPQTALGVYTVTVGPDVRDTFGNLMDQDNDLLPGEPAQDRFVSTFRVEGPRVIAQSPVGAANPPVSGLTLTFNRPMDPTTFTTDDVASFTGPDGTSLLASITDVAPVAGTNNTQFRITFAEQTARGGYTLVVGPDIRDAAGVALDQNNNLVPGEVPGDRYTATFTIPFVYTAEEVAPPLTGSIVGQAGTQVALTTADDTAVQILLGDDRFNFYGVAYDRLFVSSNGLITFGSGNVEWINGNLSLVPAQAAIAPLWDDYIKEPGDTTGPMLVYRFEDVAGGGRRLIIEWNQVKHWDSGRTDGGTFQAILTLNTGGQAGDVVLNYLDLDFDGTLFDNGASATVGVKDVGGTGTQPRTLVHFPGGGLTNPVVQTGRAIRLTGA